MTRAPEYRFELDEAYLRTAEARFLEVQPPTRRWLNRLLPFVIYLMIAGWIAWNQRAKPILAGAAVVGVGLVFWFSYAKERRRQRNPYKGKTPESLGIRISLGQEGLEIETGDTHVRQEWSVITAARAFGDGLLLFEGPRAYRWLPDSALGGAQRAEVDELLRQHVPGVSSAR